MESSTKCWICGNSYVEGDVRVRDWHITRKYRGSPHRGYNIKLKWNHHILIVFYNLTNYDAHLLMQELGKFDFERSVISIGLEKYMNCNINSKLAIID